MKSYPEFDRYAIERNIRGYSNDLLSGEASAVSRAQSLLTDWEYLERGIIRLLRQQVCDTQRAEANIRDNSRRTR